MKKIMAAHQPNFIGYLGFYDKMRNCDVFVIRDECQFAERDWHHRNKIKIQGKDQEGNPNSKWINAPVYKNMCDLGEIKINNNTMQKNIPWNRFLLRQIQSNYETAPYFKQYYPKLEEIFMNRHEKLIDLNLDIINFIKDSFGIKTEMIKATEVPGYKKSLEPNQDLINLTKLTNSQIYLSGNGARTYLNMEMFSKEGIEVRFQEFSHPKYPQRYEGFVPYMASIDALFNCGKDPCVT